MKIAVIDDERPARKELVHQIMDPWKWLTVICCTAALLSGERPWSINIMF